MFIKIDAHERSLERVSVCLAQIVFRNIFGIDKSMKRNKIFKASVT
jgi:hypothetical protein